MLETHEALCKFGQRDPTFLSAKIVLFEPRAVNKSRSFSGDAQRRNDKSLFLFHWKLQLSIKPEKELEWYSWWDIKVVFFSTPRVLYTYIATISDFAPRTWRETLPRVSRWNQLTISAILDLKSHWSRRFQLSFLSRFLQYARECIYIRLPCAPRVRRRDRAIIRAIFEKWRRYSVWIIRQSFWEIKCRSSRADLRFLIEWVKNCCAHFPSTVITFSARESLTRASRARESIFQVLSFFLPTLATICQWYTFISKHVYDAHKWKYCI